MSQIIKQIDQETRKKTVARCRDRNIIIPTFEQIRFPDRIPARVREHLPNVGLWDVNPLNLFRITWKNDPADTRSESPAVKGCTRIARLRKGACGDRVSGAVVDLVELYPAIDELQSEIAVFIQSHTDAEYSECWRLEVSPRIE